MNQVTDTEPEYTAKEIHDMTVKLLAGVLGKNDAIVQAMRYCRHDARCSWNYKINYMLCPECHRPRHRLARSLFTLGFFHLSKETTLYETVITPTKALPANLARITDTFNRMLEGLRVQCENFIAFCELTLVKGRNSFWPHLNVITDQKIESRPEPSPKSKHFHDMLVWASDLRINQRLYYDFDTDYQEERAIDHAFQRLDYLAKPLTSSWRNANTPTATQDIRFMMANIEEIHTLTSSIKTGGVFDFPGIDYNAYQVMNNQKVDSAAHTNRKGFDLKERARFLMAILAYWYELEHGKRSSEIADILKLKGKTKLIQTWRKKFGGDNGKVNAVSVLVKAGKLKWNQPAWDQLESKKRMVVETAIEHPQYNELLKQAIEITGLSKQRVDQILKEFDLSTVRKRVRAKAIMEYKPGSNSDDDGDSLGDQFGG